MSVRGQIFTSAIAISAALACTPAAAQTEQRRGYQLKAQDLGSALRAVGRTSNSEIFFETDIVDGKRAPALKGQYTPREAVEALIQGTNLVILERRGAIIIRERFPASQAAVNDSSGQSEIIVTGSRIRGGPATSPVTTISRRDAERAGQTDLGQIIRDIPQNFSGGQNPTIAGPGQGGTQNGTGSSALNLRGLGPDASLTLINGHRVAFDAIYQGVDISAIPLAAIDRIDILTDGASALYGSDAVGGVANVVLRRRIDGIVTSARFGASTSGGGETQQYSVAGGPIWSSGSLMLAGEFRKSTEIAGRHRAYTQAVAPDATMIAGQKQFSFVLAGEQSLGSLASLELDGHYMHRSVPQCLTGSVAAPQLCRANGSVVATDVDSWSISPAIKFSFGNGWKARIGGTYSGSESSVETRVISAGTQLQLVRPNYLNKLKAIEFGAEGPIFTLPGGAARLAVGAGYRTDKLGVDSRTLSGGIERQTVLFTETRKIGFAYGELFLPLIAPETEIPLIEKLQIVGALRYEDHRGVGAVTTPKVGAVFAPTSSLEFKGSWGKSFKVPTLYQTGQLSNAQLVPSTRYTPAPSTNLPVLFIFGGNPNLGPERATTWTISASYAPHFLDGFKVEASYYRIRYRDRVAAPVSVTSGAFLPIYSDFVLLNPTSQDVLGALDGVTGSFTNLTGLAFDPASVSAIFRNNLQNVSLQSLEGVDLSMRYLADFSESSRVTIKGAATYLDSKRRLTDGSPTIDQSGLIFTPAHWRGRLAASFDKHNVTLSAIANYTGGTTDNRLAPTVKIGSFKTFDTIVTIRSTAASGLFSGIEWRAGAQNIFGEKPDIIRSTYPSQPPFDSLNQSLLGRVVSFTLSKVW